MEENDELIVDPNTLMQVQILLSLIMRIAGQPSKFLVCHMHKFKFKYNITLKHGILVGRSVRFAERSKCPTLVSGLTVKCQ